MFQSLGIEKERLLLQGQTPAYHDHLQSYHQVDIGLDTFPYHGTTTSCEALWMGVPVVTLAGDRHVSRVGVTLLTNVGLAELVARDEQEYVKLAVSLAQDVNRLGWLRGNLRQGMKNSPLMQAKEFTQELEGHYQTIWQKWCRSSRVKGRR